jgi:hypothetical protein
MDILRYCIIFIFFLFMQGFPLPWRGCHTLCCKKLLKIQKYVKKMQTKNY